MKINTVQDLAMLITMLDAKEDGNGSQLSFTHATSIGWKIVKGHKKNLRKRHLIKFVIDNLDVLHGVPINGNEKKSKFTHNQLQRVMTTLNELLRWYWWPWSKVRKDLDRLCKR